MDYLSYGYALAITLGGVIGYVKAGSFVSLMMGLTFGGLSGYGAYLSSKDSRNFWLLFLCSAVLGGVMGYRALNSGKFMPSGLIAFISALMVVRLFPRLFTDDSAVS